MNNLQELIADPSSTSSQLLNRMFVEAFDLLPDAAFMFSGDRRLVGANPAAVELTGSAQPNGTACCEMFWYVEGADGCVVDRAIQTGERVEVEIMAGSEGQNSISVIVEPFKFDGSGNEAGALVIARDISDLR
ncbi:MAG TPA: PAS domain-containing protein, partial [Pyrinomonadaceae bacterium]|nr:PAS domain-containing protein [Pyrinomonadaceae bacterium]